MEKTENNLIIKNAKKLSVCRQPVNHTFFKCNLLQLLKSILL